jgi:hypothetical protein
MGVEYINIGSPNNLSEILCESKVRVGGWYCGFIFGESCWSLSSCFQPTTNKQQHHDASNKPKKLMHAMPERPNQRVVSMKR